MGDNENLRFSKVAKKQHNENLENNFQASIFFRVKQEE